MYRYYIDQNQITVRMRTLPGCVHAFSIPNGDGYTVVINDCLSCSAKKCALCHEIDHIKNNDHFSDKYIEYED